MISVVIPLYNKQESIVATLQSILAQTYTDYEVIVVDDGSTDNSAQVVEEFIREFKGERLEVKGMENGNAESTASTPYTLHSTPSIRVIHQPNAGVSAARNTGIMEAKGEYIAFLDGDDLWHPEYLETLQQLIVDYPDAALYGIGCTKICGDMIPEKILSSNERGEIEDVWKHYPSCWTGSSSCSSRKRLIEVGLFDTRMTHGEDIDMWWRLLLSGKGVFDNRVLAYYRQDTENRAMNKLIPLEKHIPYYMEKYAEARANNMDFRRFFDRQMIYILYPYLFIYKYKKTAKIIAKNIDYSLLKWTMKFRIVCPRTYSIYQLLRCKQ